MTMYQRIGAAAVWLACVATAAAAPAGDGKAFNAETLKRALEHAVTLDIGDQPLPQVVAKLADLAQVPILLDRSALQFNGVDPSEANVSIRVKNVPLRQVLRNVSGQHGLSYGVVGDAILIATEETVCYRQLRQRVTLDLSGQPFLTALRDLARQTGTNIVLDPRQQKKVIDALVTLQLDDVPLETAVRIIAEIGGLKPVRLGNVLFVTSEERADKLRPDAEPLPSPGMPFMGGMGGGVGVVAPVPAPAQPAPAQPVPAPPPPPKKD